MKEFLTCSAFPHCMISITIPQLLDSIQLTKEKCETCVEDQQNKQSTIAPIKAFKYKMKFSKDYVDEELKQYLNQDLETTNCLRCLIDKPETKAMNKLTNKIYDKEFVNAKAKPKAKKELNIENEPDPSSPIAENEEKQLPQSKVRTKEKSKEGKQTTTGNIEVSELKKEAKKTKPKVEIEESEDKVKQSPEKQTLKDSENKELSPPKVTKVKKMKV